MTIRSNVDRRLWDTDDVPALLRAAVSASHRAGDYLLRQFRKQVRAGHKIPPGVAGSPATSLVSFVAWLPSADRLADRVLAWMDLATERGRS